MELAWGEERQLSLKANEWKKLIFTSFTGVRTELGPTSYNPSSQWCSKPLTKCPLLRRTRVR